MHYEQLSFTDSNRKAIPRIIAAWVSRNAISDSWSVRKYVSNAYAISGRAERGLPRITLIYATNIHVHSCNSWPFSSSIGCCSFLGFLISITINYSQTNNTRLSCNKFYQELGHAKCSLHKDGHALLIFPSDAAKKSPVNRGQRN